MSELMHRTSLFLKSNLMLYIQYDLASMLINFSIHQYEIIFVRPKYTCIKKFKNKINVQYLVPVKNSISTTVEIQIGVK